MKSNIFLAGMISIFFFTGCSEDKKLKTDSDATTTEQQMTIPVVNTDSLQTAPVTPPSDKPVMQVQAADPAKPATGAGLNPPHGEPGHDCAIAVGAPLNSAKVNAAPSTTTSSPQITAQPINVQPSNTPPSQTQSIKVNPTPSGPTPPGMNPPHGEPGHDCAIAVGAPLKK